MKFSFKRSQITYLHHIKCFLCLLWIFRGRFFFGYFRFFLSYFGYFRFFFSFLCLLSFFFRFFFLFVFLRFLIYVHFFSRYLKWLTEIF
ncbi:hypothetical protein CEE45_07385 [Candidatus Heimdallarchaeota archaeon B3_Heim]|nr:MAG: hypothetical protein CEE45_07385 [Candidatus Heimdallarchaeota archaeon B3_Heim]